jgi:rhamnosyltransferase
LSKATVQTEFDFLLESASAGCTLVIDKISSIYLKEEIVKNFAQLPFETSHDWFTYAITRIGGFKWYLDSRSFIYYRQHSLNQYGANEGIQGIKKILIFFISGWYLRNIILLTNLFCPSKPLFYNFLVNYNELGFVERIKFASMISRYRRKSIHKLCLFFLIVFKILK